MADLNISSYSTANTINVEEGFHLQTRQRKDYDERSFRNRHNVFQKSKENFRGMEAAKPGPRHLRKRLLLSSTKYWRLNIEGIRPAKKRKNFRST